VTDETMLDEIARLRTTTRDLWHELQAANPGTPGSLAIQDAEIAEAARVDVDTVRPFLISEDGRGIVVKAEGSALSVSMVEPGYGE
jgi:hypothetical protein